jgi:hypothetical protein
MLSTARVRPDRTDSPAPHAACRLRLILCSAAPRAFHLDSRCAQSRSDLRAMASNSVPASSSASTSIHWGTTSRWAHVAIICFMRFKCMLHMFYLDVAKVDLVLHMLQWLYTYVASVCFKCFSCFKRILQVFYLDVAYVALALHVCCKYRFKMFQLFQTYVASVLSRCCLCCSAHIHMLQTYVINVSCVSDVCCSQCFMLQVLHEQTRQGGAGECGPSDVCCSKCFMFHMFQISKSVLSLWTRPPKWDLEEGYSIESTTIIRLGIWTWLSPEEPCKVWRRAPQWRPK